MTTTTTTNNQRIRSPSLAKYIKNMTLEFGVAVKAQEEYIEILKQELLFAMAAAEEYKHESTIGIQEIISIKRELDKAVHERMKLNRIYCNYESSSVLPAASIPLAASA